MCETATEDGMHGTSARLREGVEGQDMDYQIKEVCENEGTHENGRAERP